MSLRQLVDTYKELDEYERKHVRIEYTDDSCIETAITRVAEGASSVWELDAYSTESAHRSLGEEMMGCMLDEPLLKEHGQDFILNYIDYESYGHDLILGGDYSLVVCNGTYYAVSQH